MGYYDENGGFSVLRSNEEEAYKRLIIVGLCFGVEANAVAAALGLYPFELGGEGFHRFSRNADEMIVSLLSFVSRAKVSPIQNVRNSFQAMSATLDTEGLDHDSLTILNKNLGRRRDMLKRNLGDLDELLRMTKEDIEKELRKRNDILDDTQDGPQEAPQESAELRPKQPGKKEVIFQEMPEPRPKRPGKKELIFQEMLEFMAKLANSQIVARDETYHLLQDSRDLRDKVRSTRQ